MLNKNQNKIRRLYRLRKKLRKISDRPRLSIFRSNKYIYAQVIDDSKGKTVVSINSLKEKLDKKVKKSDQAKILGKLLADKSVKKGVKTVVFDRGSYKYHGVIKAFAEGAREGGLQF